MTDRALANAEKRRDEIAAQINTKIQEVEILRKQMSVVERFIAEWHRYADDLIGTVEIQARNSPDTGHEDVTEPRMPWETGEGVPQNDSPPPKARKNPDRGIVGQHAKEIILNAGRPVSRTDLFDALAQRGIHIRGKDPEMVLSTMMWRMQKEFVRIQGAGYWLRDRPWNFYIPGVSKDEPAPEDTDIFHIASADEDL